MKLNRHFNAMRILVTAILFSGVVSCFGANLPEELAESDRHFGSGGTNAPLLELDWLSGPRTIYFCRVGRTGDVFGARNVINWAVQGGHRAQLDQTNLELLATTMKSLPSPVSQTLPKERLLVVRGFRTNQWFEFVYDRADVPKEVEKLYEITGAYLEWFMPEVNGRRIAHSEYGHYFTSQTVIGSFHVAASAPLAVSSGVNGLVVWNLAKGTATPLLFMKSIPNADFEGPWGAASISPDGNIIGYASQYATYALDWKAEKILWQGNRLGGLGTDNKIAIGGDKAQFLFVAAAGQIERWDLATGKQLAVLASNQPTIHFLGTSRDGKVLVAGFAGMESMPTSITVWKSGEDKPSANITLPESAGIAISPDGRKIAFSVFAEKGLKIWDWQNDTTKEVPLRTPYASSRAYAMFWSPDKTKFAAYVDTYPSSIVVYDALDWKPLAHWKCGQVMSEAKFDFASDGEFVELRDHDLTGLDLKSLTELK